MADGGFVVKFDGKIVKRCYAVAVDYDKWERTYNHNDTAPLPATLKAVTIEVEVLPEGKDSNTKENYY